MRIIDLSHAIEKGIQVFPGNTKPDIVPALTIAKDGCNVATLILGTHTGTHIDAPYHDLERGKTVEEFDLDCFVGEACVVDMRTKSNREPIGVEDLRPYEKRFPGRLVLLLTGWDKKMGSEQYLDHPYLTPGAAEMLTHKGVKIVGTDCINLDPSPNGVDGAFPVHKVLLSADIMIAENLTRLDAIQDRHATVFLLPLKIRRGDGSPIRAFAVLD